MRTIRKLLVANRGEIARRVIRGAHARGVATVAVFSDADSALPHPTEADEAVRLPGNSPSETYLRADLIVEAALKAGADAVHPGYGFLSENASFAAACEDAGLTFVGPSASAIAQMGDKLAAKELVARSGVPTLESYRVDLTDPDALARQAKGLGLPVLLKAAAGGGGRGMRVVDDVSDLLEVARSASREAESSFGDGTIFMERYLARPRHVEVQVFGDSHGTTVHLFERECSIQRRHQKIVEESPSPALTAELRSAMGEAAVAVARAVDYVGAGTVEFLLDEDGSFYFLEMNTRLQVEHPVTEAVTGLDLVALQLAVAEGSPLPTEALSACQSGHAIEVRIYAEDPVNGWMPSTGTLHTFEVPGADAFRLSDQGLRLDAGFEAGNQVTPYYDPMLAKVIAWGPDRRVAANRLARSLSRARIHGVVTNRDLLVAVLSEEEFLSGGTDTAYLSRHDPVVLGASRLTTQGERLHAVAAAMASQARRRSSATAFAHAPSGWRNNPSEPQRVSYRSGSDSIEVLYSFGRNGVELPADPDLLVVSAGEDEVRVAESGVMRSCLVVQAGKVFYVDSPLGASVLEEEPRFPSAELEHAPGSLLSPMPGTVVRVAVQVGDRVHKGDELVVMEAMKMEHTLVAPFSGTVTEVRAREGDQVEGSSVLVVVDGDG